MKKIDWSDMPETKEYKRLVDGAYICKIIKVMDVPLNKKTDKGDYLLITVDIVDGDYSGFYEDLRERMKAKGKDTDWIGRFFMSYKDSVKWRFKLFCDAVSHSNGNYVFDGSEINSDEQTLVGKKVGLILQEEPYDGNDGITRTRFSIYRSFAVNKLNEQKLPPRKMPDTGAIDSTNSVFVPAGVDEELPFA